MLRFKEFITEGYKNLFTHDQKKKYADEAFAQLQQSYAKIGGIHGSGFKDVDDFIKNIPFWKLRLDSNGKLIAGAYYKDRGGRKRVAVSSDGTALGKKYVADIMISDMTHGRAFVEQSSSSLAFLVKQLGSSTVKQYAINPKTVEKILGEKIGPVKSSDPEVVRHPELKDFFYTREIGGVPHTKIALGTTGKIIVEDYESHAQRSSKVNGWNIIQTKHGIDRDSERMGKTSSDAWKEFFQRVTNKINSYKIKTSGEYLYSSMSLKMNVVLNADIDRKQLRVITVLPPNKAIPKPGTKKVIVENQNYELIEID